MRLVPIAILFLFSIHANSQTQFPTYTFTNNGIDSGYFLFTPTEQNSMNPSSGHYLVLLDYTGHIIYYYDGNNQTGSSTANFKIRSNKLFSFYKGGKNYLADSNFNVVDTIMAANGCIIDSHDMLLLSNGNYLILVIEKVIMDLSAYNLFTYTFSPGDSNALVSSGVIQEFNPAGQLVWEWKARDHFEFDDVHPFWLFNPDTLDWTHFNALEEDTDGNILVSSRFFNEIFKINKNTDSVMWRLGGYNNQFTFINDSVPFRGQHDIRVMPDGSYTLFDNGYFYPSHKAKALQYLLDTDSHTATCIRKIYAENLGVSGSRGNAQFLNDGKVVIDWGEMSNDNLVFSVVDSNNIEICRFSFIDSLTSYRTAYYPELPFKINQPQISCFDSMGITLLKAPAGYSEYLWSNGSTESSIIAQSPDTVWVYVNQGTMNGMLSSEKFIVDASINCGTFINDYKNKLIKIYPNPVSDNIFISGEAVSEIEIENIFGQIVFSENYFDSLQTHAISIRNFSQALYILKIISGGNQFFYKMEKM